MTTVKSVSSRFCFFFFVANSQLSVTFAISRAASTPYPDPPLAGVCWKGRNFPLESIITKGAEECKHKVCGVRFGKIVLWVVAWCDNTCLKVAVTDHL